MVKYFVIYVSRRLNFFNYCYSASEKYQWRGTLFKRRALSNVTASVTLLRSSRKNICGIPRAIVCCIKKKRMETNRYCSSVVHLLRGRELGFRNALATRNDVPSIRHSRSIIISMAVMRFLMIAYIHTLLHAIV